MMSTIRSFFNGITRPATIPDANHWMTLCKMYIGLHPGRAVTATDSVTQKRQVTVYLSPVGVSLTVLHIAYTIMSIVILTCTNQFKFRNMTIDNTNMALMEGLILTGLNFIHVAVIFFRLLWHREMVHMQTIMLLALERRFAELGIDVEIRRRRTFKRAFFWAIGFFALFMVHLAHLIFFVPMENFPWATIVVFVAVLLLPPIYKQSFVYFFLYDLSETRRNIELLNCILLTVLDFERSSAAAQRRTNGNNLCVPKLGMI